MTDALSQNDGESPALSSQLDQALQQANQSLNSIEQAKADAMELVQGIKTTAENVASNERDIGTLLAYVKKQAEDIEAVHTNAQAQLKECISAKEEADAAAALLKGLSDKAQTVEKRIADYETRLAELAQQSEQQLEVITGLLPGATSAGLAAAFDERRKSFLSPTQKWQWLFVGSVISLVVLAGTGMFHLYEGGRVLGYDELLRLWLGRAPVAAALVWLAIHASRESALAKRLEEDYGYKAAVAASFQGFHKQMAEIEERAGNDSPLTRLCVDTLATIGSPPGRIYERHRLTVTPTDEIKDGVKALADKTPLGRDMSKQEGN